MVIKAKKSTNGNSHKTATLKVKAQTKGQPKPMRQEELERHIRDRAYYIHLNRGCSQGGCANQDWYEAEKQVKKELRLN